MNNSTPPPGWGKDPVTYYLDASRTNQFATFFNKKQQVADLLSIDDVFRKLFTDVVDPKPLLPMGFLLRSHSAYLTAVDFVMAGKLFELHALLRLCLEHASLGHFIGVDQKRWEDWMARHDAQIRNQRSNWRKRFSHGNVVSDLRRAAPNLGDVYSKLYDQTIDYGGHPNERGTSMNSGIEERADGSKILQTQYLNPDELMLNFCLKETAQVGICVLRIAQLIYPAQIQENGSRRQIEELCARY